MAKFSLSSSIKQSPWQPDILYLLDFMAVLEGNIDVSIYGFACIKKNPGFFSGSVLPSTDSICLFVLWDQGFRVADKTTISCFV